MQKAVLLFVLSLVGFCCLCSGASDSYDGLRLRHVQRNIDLTSQVARHNIILGLANAGTQAASHMVLTFEESLASRLSVLTVREESGAKLSVDAPSAVQTTADGVKYRAYRVDLGRSLAPQDSLNLVVSAAFTHAMRPSPAEIGQNDRQLVLYEDNNFFFAPYETLSQKTVIKLASTSVEHYSQDHAPFVLKGDTLTYGPYQDRAPFSRSPLVVHFENNQPFITVSNLEKTIEISHWGNANVEESYELRHDGAALHGEFSRFDYRRTGKGPFVRSITHVLPVDARDIYYRDEIGNISTSAVSATDRALLLELTPRFPLFGGWKTKFYMGYDLPLQYYLFNDVQDSSRFMLNISFAKDFTTDVVIDQLTVKVILPEGVKDIVAHPPFAVDSQGSDLHFTYLDTTGRPVLVLTKKNVVAEHNQFFQVTYHFSRLSMLQEPVLLISAYFMFFVFAMLYVRFELSITKESKVEAENDGRVEDLLYKVKDIHDQRAELHNSLKDATEKVGKSKNVAQYNSEKKNIELNLSKLQTEMLVVINELEDLDEVKAAQVRQIDRDEQAKQAYLDELIRVEAQYRDKRMVKSVHEESKAQFEKNYSRVDEEIDRLIGDLLEDL